MEVERKNLTHKTMCDTIIYMTQAQIQSTILEQYRKQAQERADEISMRVKKLREQITRQIGPGFDVVRAIREMRQER